MDRFSTRLAASLIDDRHRDAVAMRRFADLRPIGTTCSDDSQRGAVSERIQRILSPIRVRAGHPTPEVYEITAEI